MHFIKLFIFLALPFLFYSQNSQRGLIPPQFPGGKKAFENYVYKYTDYPSIGREMGLQDIVTATIYISKEGKVKFVNATSKEQVFKTEVKRVLSLMPNWSISTMNGVPIDTFITQKVYFTLGKTSRAKSDSSAIEIVTYSVPMSNADTEKYNKEIKERQEKNQKGKIYVTVQLLL